jgi:hypothetical protein
VESFTDVSFMDFVEFGTRSSVSWCFGSILAESLGPGNTGIAKGEKYWMQWEKNSWKQYF